MNELTAMLAQSRAREICELLARELSTSTNSELVAMLVGETLLKEAIAKIAGAEGTEAALRRWLAFQLDISNVVIAFRPAPGRKVGS